MPSGEILTRVVCYKNNSCFRTYLLGWRPKHHLKDAKNPRIRYFCVTHRPGVPGSAWNLILANGTRSRIYTANIA